MNHKGLSRIRLQTGAYAFWLGALGLLIITSLVYLPRIHQLTYYRDDWYYILDGISAGPKIFHSMFAIDRPARGFLFEWIFSLFGYRPLPYYLSFFFWRYFASLAAYCLINALWPEKKLFAFIAAIFFCVFPGYTWWVSGIEYQPMIISLCLQVISIYFTVLAVRFNNTGLKALALAGSILTGWLYIALVDYAGGAEVFRWMCVWIVLRHKYPDTKKQLLFLQFLKYFALLMVIPLGYLYWNLFVFQNQRPETDLPGQLSSIINSPLLRGGWVVVSFIKSCLYVGILTWFVSFFQTFPPYSLLKTVESLCLGFLTSMVFLFLIRFIPFKEFAAENKCEKSDNHSNNGIWKSGEAWILGITGLFAGILPIVLANRSVDLDRFSHYALPSSLAAALLLTTFLFSFQKKLIRNVVAIMTSFGRRR